jgi:hypothetical protein
MRPPLSRIRFRYRVDAGVSRLSQLRIRTAPGFDADASKAGQQDTRLKIVVSPVRVRVSLLLATLDQCWIPLFAAYPGPAQEGPG